MKKTYTATIVDEFEDLVISGTSDGKGDLRYEVGEAYQEPRESFLALLEEAYETGLYGTGSIGQVRDMVHAMGRVAEQFDFELVVPEKTEKKVEAEAAAEDLPAGAVH